MTYDADVNFVYLIGLNHLKFESMLFLTDSCIAKTAILNNQTSRMINIQTDILTMY